MPPPPRLALFMPRPIGLWPKIQSSHRLWAATTRRPSQWSRPAPGTARLFSSSAPRPSQPQIQAHSPGPSSSNQPPPPPPPPPPPGGQRTNKPFHLRPSTYVFLTLGVLLGSAARFLISPPAPPTPGSAEDAARLAQIRAEAESLPALRALAADPKWTRSWDAYASVPEAARPHRLTSGALAGSRGLAFQRVFRAADDDGTGETAAVVYLGASTAGWPGTVHGGASATLLDESMGRCALAALPGRAGVTASLELRYVWPVVADRFHVVRCRPLREEELAPGERGKRDRKVWVVATVEDLKGTVCVEAKALFVAPRGIKLAPLGDEF
ncbi:hypothetical protein GGTG_11730 [Gaeumannomyces tritici R3-111a-1]|uniref:Thioesterase domain-containing protein n=1 Tax=Gaeumannomyces tritici (strain R3-111a-1) TaxID=644352 RepID=J3PE07_GAET3|nr:hypothetical protein GGTG_11730 [Gaeumannomyces tritici R3-111a-1]EJT70707.1 hypothetical protein GGTG_11730 [Gaeumannomyces tritici R3-111a-1]